MQFRYFALTLLMCPVYMIQSMESEDLSQTQLLVGNITELKQKLEEEERKLTEHNKEKLDLEVRAYHLDRYKQDEAIENISDITHAIKLHWQKTKINKVLTATETTSDEQQDTDAEQEATAAPIEPQKKTMSWSEFFKTVFRF
ncbi:MAG TPA: hypothetical protein PLU71_00275 [Candidatus Dependentiae bacterium]|nr:hypothetical protein [Candidatus Dependentiae bacterium]HRQ62273.1 hypothetical protein [Candidatus Dependentiae bacterium]